MDAADMVTPFTKMHPRPSTKPHAWKPSKDATVMSRRLPRRQAPCGGSPHHAKPSHPGRTTHAPYEAIHTPNITNPSWGPRYVWRYLGWRQSLLEFRPIKLLISVITLGCSVCVDCVICAASGIHCCTIGLSFINH